MPAPKDNVHETSTTGGTGNLTLTNVNGKVNFSDATYGFGTGGTDVFDYYIDDRDSSNWERGTGSMSDATTLVRDTVIASTNSDAAVNFTASNTLDVTNDIPAANQVTTDTAQTIAAAKTFSTAPNLAADSVDALTEIASALKSGADATLITGTAGTANNVPIWNADGDIVDGGASIADLQQTTEEIQDIAGGMFTGNTETGITATYQDADGTIDLATDVTKSGTPSNNQVAIWTGDGPIEGDAALTFDSTSDTLAIAAGGDLAFGAVVVLSDTAGTTTLQNIDALDATTEATIEAAIDTLANLTAATSLASVGTITTGTWQGTTIALNQGGTGATTAAGAATNLGLGTGDSPQFTAVNIGAATDTTLTRVSAGVAAIEGTTLATVDDVEISDINAQTDTAHTLVIGDRGQTVTMDNASANTLTIPTNASVAFDTGTVVHVIQIGAGVTTITGDTGVTVNGVSAGSGAINNRYQGVSLLKVATNTWIASGDIATVA